MHLRRTLSVLFVLLATLIVANAQNARRTKSALAVPQATLIRITRAEDERRWDDGLKNLLANENARVRERSALAAGRIGDDRAVPALADLALTDKDSGVREMAVFAL